MANPADIRPDIPGNYFRHQQAIAARRARLLINYGILLVSIAGSAIISITVSNTSAAIGGGEVYLLIVAFRLFLIGVWMLMLGIAADEFPGAARAVARALHHYLFGGGN